MQRVNFGKWVIAGAALTAILVSGSFVIASAIRPAYADELKVDGSSKEAFEKSLKAMVDTLKPEDKEA